ncbi:unnamed protein product [Caenorhabditis auriculariae]|uniref:Uncharacterized protein n=1 Tax=Caenorhabditis auriculariae TaxID=2777116 RepID=A0A8S1HEH9_9PELO|nr:unnamed protein product [Caenorhabditis auriculariae]
MKYLTALALCLVLGVSARPGQFQHQDAEFSEDVEHLIQRARHPPRANDAVVSDEDIDMMLKAILESPVPIFGRGSLKVFPPRKPSSSTPNTVNPSTEAPVVIVEPTFVERTKKTLEEDVEMLKGMYANVRTDIDTWMAYPQTKAYYMPMLIGSVSALLMLLVFYTCKSFCSVALRRRRMRRVAAFENELFDGVTKDLLNKGKNTPRIPQRPSNSDEDI